MRVPGGTVFATVAVAMRVSGGTAIATATMQKYLKKGNIYLIWNNIE